MVHLNINIDHVATIRNARGGEEPKPVTAALEAELAGATGIVCHLREDRRHVKDRDVALIRDLIQTKMDLEMAANEKIIKIALKTKPDLVTIVPEKRQELTTEGGLNVAKEIERFKKLSNRMHEKGIEVSYFIEPEIEQIDAVLSASGDMVEFHTGTYANLRDREEIKNELTKIENAVQYAVSENLLVAVGHGLNYYNIRDIAMIKGINEFSIGHSIISRSIFSGIKQAVSEMLNEIRSSIQIMDK